MTTAAHTLPAAGTRVGTVCGPCGNPAHNAGTVLCLITDSYGTYAIVLMDTGKIDHCFGLDQVGIGWYALGNKE